MSRKSAVYLNDESIATIEAGGVKGHDGTVEVSVSGRINAILARYDRLVREHAPELTIGEWCAICDANNGAILDDIPRSVSYMWANVADYQGLGEKWGIDADRLAVTMRSWGYAQQIACAEIVQRFWSDTSRNDNKAWLTEVGAKIR